MSIYTKLMEIQKETKVPKNMFNSFGKFKYRNAESILESVKPILNKYGCVLLISDDIKQMGDRYYIEAKATLVDTEDNSSVTVTSLAREAEDKKGMDAMQLSGCASSYARKYCLNGLFLLDDSKDADTDEFKIQTSDQSRQALIKTVKSAGKRAGINTEGWLSSCGRTWETITETELTQMLQTIRDRENEVA